MVDMEYHSKIHKIIFVGSIHGKFSKLFKKIHKINQEHGPFEAMICPGRVFGVNNEEWQLILSGQLICPIPLFILGPQNSQDQDYYQNNPSPSLAGLIAPNIYCLGSNGIYVTSSDIQIAFISLSCLPDGSWGIHPENVNYITEYLKNSTNFKGVDFLISPVWPAKVVNYVNPTEIPKQFISENGEINVNFGDETISKLASVLQPRYHICQFDSDESIYYQRPPYRNHGNLQTFQKPHHLTHFVSVGAFENSQKFKDTYAVKISPITQMCYSDLCIAPPDTTQNPYPKYMSIIESNQSHSALNKKSLAGLQNKSASLTVSDCWFCLDNPKIQLHMIFYISQFVFFYKRIH
uniref:CWF19-like protein 1 (Trinotate prediction) n=1 Tax=Henneguya salminicola TaxID=69463 RepID=A0A6G3ME56_HENSL